jgi:hypothetical protein
MNDVVTASVVLYKNGSPFRYGFLTGASWGSANGAQSLFVSTWTIYNDAATNKYTLRGYSTDPSATYGGQSTLSETTIYRFKNAGE